MDTYPAGAFGEIGSWDEITAVERKVFRAVGKAHVATNLPIFTHTGIPGKSALEQLDILEDAGVASCHGWSGESSTSPFATLTGARAMNDPSATNVAQIVISGTRRHTPDGAVDACVWQRIFRCRDRRGCQLCHLTVRRG